MMDATERAVRLTGVIASLLNIDPDKDTWHKSNLNAVQKELAAQIEEAERKAVKELMLTELSPKQVFKEGFQAGKEDIATHDKWHKAGFEDGFKTAREKAKGIAESPIINYEGCEPKECYECDCHGEVPQKYIAQRIGELEP